MKRSGFWPLAIFAVALAACSDAGGPTGADRLPEASGSAAAVASVAGAFQLGTVGQAVPDVPAVVVTDAAGDPAVGVEVRFEITAGGGSLGRAAAVTDAEGQATPERWTLGRAAGENALMARVVGLDGVRFTALAEAGPAAALVARSGDAQAAEAGRAVAAAPSIVVRDGYGNAVGGAAVTFTVTAGGGSVAGGTRTSDAQGIATVGSWTMGPQAGTNLLTASVNGAEPVTFTATATAAATGSYNIAVRYIGSPSARQRLSVERAVERWRTVITGDIPSVPVNVAAGSCGGSSPAMNETVDDLLIFVDFGDIDGAGKILGQAGPCFVRSGSTLPIVGQLKLDNADLQLMEQNGSIDDVVLHEIGHILGIGTLWQSLSLLSGAGTSDPFFTGLRARDAYRQLGPTSASSVPVENSGGEGTRDGHWRESVFGNELMTGYISSGENPLSAVTVGSLLDMGYNANLGASSGYTLYGSGYGGLRLAEHEELKKPTLSIDPDGRQRMIP